MCQFSCQAEIIPFTRRRTGGEDILYYTLFFKICFLVEAFHQSQFMLILHSWNHTGGEVAKDLSALLSHTHARTHARTHMYTRARACARTYARARALIRARLRTHTRAHTHIRTYTLTHALALICMPTHVHSHTHAHTRVRVSYRVGSSFDPVSVMYFCLQKSRLPTGLGV